MKVAALATKELHWVYSIDESEDLPRVDCARTVKHLLLGGPLSQRLNRWLSRKRRWLAIALFVGIVSTFAVPFLPAEIGRAVAVVGFFQLPSIVAALICLRYDMIRLILGTYEFWSLTCMNVAFFIASSAAYNDARIIGLVPGLFSFELLLLQDANYRALNLTIALFCFIAIVHVALTVYVAMQLIDEWHVVHVIRYGTHSVTADNIVTTYLINTTAVLLRNAYRKHKWVNDGNDGETTIVRCIAYNCRVRLSLQKAPRVADIPHNPRPLTGKMELIRLVPSDQVYDSALTVSHRIVAANKVMANFSTWRSRLCLYAVGSAGLSMACISLVYQPQALDIPPNNDPLEHQDPSDQHLTWVFPLLSIASASATGLFCGLFVSLYQRQLLYKLLTSFDFLLLSTNITIVHLCVADTFNWTPKCLGLLSSWMWIMWATTTDALTPNLRQELGLRTHFVLIVVLVFVLLVVLLVVEIVFMRDWDLHDRDLFRLWRTHVKVVQVLFSCLFSLLPMCCRIVWRLYHAREGDLILIQGIVEHEDAVLAQRRKRELSSRISKQSRRSFHSQKSRSFVLLPARSSRVLPSSPDAPLWQVNTGITP